MTTDIPLRRRFAILLKLIGNKLENKVNSMTKIYKLQNCLSFYERGLKMYCRHKNKGQRSKP